MSEPAPNPLTCEFCKSAPAVLVTVAEFAGKRRTRRHGGRRGAEGMTGPEHFAAAESLASDVEDLGGDMSPEGRTNTIALAQVHAMLANAAAIVLAADAVGARYQALGEWDAAMAAGDERGP